MKTATVVLLALAACAAASPYSSFSRRHGRSLSESECFTCENDCAACTSKVAFTDTDGVEKLRVTINVSTCKGDKLSWMCCRGAGSDTIAAPSLTCSLEACDGSASGNKCDEVTYATYIVPSGSTTLTVQIHDGKQAGDVDCSDGGCCGGASGSCGTVSGVCDRTIDLTKCTPGDGCTSDVQCATLDGACALGKCNTGTGQCYAAPKPAGTVCNPATDVCDISEKCDGSSTTCPVDDVAGTSVVCRHADGLCDVAENCDGTNKACPADAVAPEGFVCREAAGVCDAEEKCDGQEKTCPTDTKKPATEVCRPAKDKCDLDEKCTGTSDDCPEDKVYRDKAKGFKCGRDCFFCGAKSKAELEQLPNTWALGSCNMGACDTFTWLDEKDPLCLGPVPLTCPNGKGLSNIEHAVCDPNTGRFNCILKTEEPFTGPVSPPW